MFEEHQDRKRGKLIGDEVARSKNDRALQAMVSTLDFLLSNIGASGRF